MYWDDRKGKLWLEISRWNSEFLFLDSLPAGMGSNDIGLDRGQLGEGRVVEFERVGPRVLLKQINLDFRASADNPAESSVEQAFAQSVLWGTEVAAEENGRVLVDATPFFMTDMHHVVAALKRTKQGSYKIDVSRSAIYLDNTRNFPQNTEVESILTFTGDEPGKWVEQVTPDPKPSRCANTIPSCSFPTTTTSRAPSIPAPVSSAHRMPITARQSVNPWSSVSLFAIAWRRRIPTQR